MPILLAPAVFSRHYRPVGFRPILDGMPSPRSQRVVFRAPGAVVGVSAFGVTAGVLLLLAGHGSGLGWVLGVGFALVCATYARWLGVVVVRSGVRVHHQIGSTVIPWNEIDRFEIDEKFPRPVWLVTTTGIRVRTWGFERPLIGREAVRAQIEAKVEALNALVLDHRPN